MANVAVVGCAAACCAVILIIIAVLISLHFSYVDLNHIGLKKDRTGGKVHTDEAYATGRYGWGIAKVAQNFESTWELVSFTGAKAPRVFTDAGEITIGVAFYYEITIEGLPTTFKAFSTRYAPIIESQALDSIKNAAANYTTAQWQTQRRQISAAIYAALRLKIETLVHVRLPPEGFFLFHVELPPRVLQKRLESFEQEQQVITQTYQLRNQQYRQETAQNVSIVERLTDVVRAQASVTAAALRDNARNIARGRTQTEAGAQLQAMVAGLNLGSDPEATLRLVQYNSMLDSTRASSTLINGITATSVVSP